jgi:arginase
MNRSTTVIGAATSIGIRPYDSGEPRRLDQAPAVLRRLGLARALGAVDAGDVVPPPYRDFVREPGRVRNEPEIVGYTESLADQISAASAKGEFVLVIGGDCSIVLAGLLGLRRAGHERVGLAYVDGHADFATPLESLTGSAASMCLGMAVGRGDTPLARLDTHPLTEPEDVVLIGRRDEGEAWYGHQALRASGILDIPHASARERGYDSLVVPTLDRLTAALVDGFWIHLDADVIDPELMPAVDSPEPGGPDLDDLAVLLGPLVNHPQAFGMEVTIYDPKLDRDEKCGHRLVELLSRAFAAAG